MNGGRRLGWRLKRSITRVVDGAPIRSIREIYPSGARVRLGIPMPNVDKIVARGVQIDIAWKATVVEIDSSE